MSKTKKTKTAKPSHVTGAGTQKYQANGPSEWAPFFKSLAEKIGGKGTPPGIGIRAALAYAKAHEKTLLSQSTEGAPVMRATNLVSKKKAAA
jgi:hypothetical protein